MLTRIITAAFVLVFRKLWGRYLRTSSWWSHCTRMIDVPLPTSVSMRSRVDVVFVHGLVKDMMEFALEFLPASSSLRVEASAETRLPCSKLVCFGH
jgi:hypothetical protein